jgi:hypothetical protein
MNLPQYLAWLGNTTFWLTLLAGVVGAMWAMSEIVGEFRAETGRALRTSGAWLLVIVNFVAAAVIFLLAINLAPAARNWPSALFIGLAWPTIFRNLTFKEALLALGLKRQALAAWWQAREIFVRLDNSSKQGLNTILSAHEKEVGSEEFSKFVAVLQSQAEEIRLAGVAEARKVAGDDELIREIAERLRGLEVE